MICGSAFFFFFFSFFHFFVFFFIFSFFVFVFFVFVFFVFVGGKRGEKAVGKASHVVFFRALLDFFPRKQETSGVFFF